MNWFKLFKAKACSVKLKADTKSDALKEVVSNLITAKLLEKDLEEAAVKTLLAREDLASTGIGMNVAIPHVKIAGIDRVVCSLSVHPEGIPWDAVDGAPVQVLFTVLRPVSASEHYNPEQHLEMMRWVARLARQSDFRSFACQAKNKTELVNLLQEMAPA